MKSWLLDESGDFVFNGRNAMVEVTEDEELLQCVRVIFRTNLGEWFLDPDTGFPRFDILGEKYDQERAVSATYAAILQEDRVASVQNIELEHEGRRLKIKFTFTKVDGEQLSGEVEV